MKPRVPTHRLDGDHALCGDEGTILSPYDSIVSCETCLALIALAAHQRRALVRRAVVLIAKLALA